MNNLIDLNKDLTMSSLEIAELTEKQHKNVLADIEVMKTQYLEFKNRAEISALFQCSEYKAKNGKMNPCVLLSKEASLDLVTGYNLQARNKINNRWQELESQQLKVPQTFQQALQLAADQQAVIEKQNLQLADNKPKVDFYHLIMSENPRLSMNEYAKMLSSENNVIIGQNKLMALLRQQKYLMTGRDASERNKPYQKYIDAGYFEVDYIKTPVGLRAQPFITAKGQTELSDHIVNSL